MGLRIRRLSPTHGRVLTTLIAIFTFVAQPMYGLVNSQFVGATSVTDHVVINEIMAFPAAGEKEWVELYNPTDKEVNLNEWRIKNGTDNFSNVLDKVKIAPYGYVVREAADSDLPLADNGSTLILQKNSSGLEIETISYAGTTQGKSYARTYDASVDWSAQAVPTKGTSNAPTQPPVVVAQPTITTEEFVTNNGSFKGLSVGFWARDF